MRKIISVIFTLLFFLSIVWADISVTPYGAVSVVSGSCFLLKTKDLKFIVDCGLFMSDEDRFTNGLVAEYGNAKSKNLQFQTELLEAEALFLTHAHLDHSGRIPLLIHKGFKGKIYSTQATKDLTLSLFGNGNGFDLIERKWFWSKDQKEKARNTGGRVTAHWVAGCERNVKSVEYSDCGVFLKDLEEKESVKFLLCKRCCREEVKKIESRFIVLGYNEDIKIAEGVAVKLINAAHIPGSVSFIFRIGSKKILFSGDLGSGYSRFNGEFDIPEKVDLIFMEATRSYEESKIDARQYESFRNDLKRALDSGKTVWIPALSFNRTQKILYELKLMQDNGELSKKIPIYSVSPSANFITALYQKEIGKKDIKHGNLTLKSRGGWFLIDIYQKGSILPENVKLKMPKSYGVQMILISSSGDMDKGRSKQLAPKMLERSDVFVMIVNYVNPKSSAGLLLQDKNPHCRVESIAEIKKYDIFSDHADFKALQKWLSKQNKDIKIYIIHSNEKDAQDMVKLLKGKDWQKVRTAKTEETINLCI